MSGKANYRLLELHDAHGPVVRLGPNELSFTMPEAWQDVMGRPKPGHKENIRSPCLRHLGHKDIIGAEPEDHARMRRVLSSGLTPAIVHEKQTRIVHHANLLVQTLREKSAGGGKAVDVNAWYNYCSIDTIGEMMFSRSFGCLRQSTIHPWMAMVFTNIHVIALSYFAIRFPILFLAMPFLFPIKLAPQYIRNSTLLEGEVAEHLSKSNSTRDLVQLMSAATGASVRISSGKRAISEDPASNNS